MAAPHNYYHLIAPRFFRQIVQIECRKVAAFQAKFVQYDGKRTSEETAKAKPLIVRCCLNFTTKKRCCQSAKMKFFIKEIAKRVEIVG